MKDRVVNAPSPTEIGDKARGEQNSPARFEDEREQKNMFQKVHDAADSSRSFGMHQKFSFVQPDFSSQKHADHGNDGHEPHAARLDEQ